MPRYTTALAVLCLVIAGAAAHSGATTITLTGTIRDFNMVGSVGGHPDFEAYLGDDRGIVRDTLGPDGKPVYNSDVFHPTVTSQESFDQWFRDVPCLNMSMPFAITLDNALSGNPDVYVYANWDFFPIDGMLLGNEGLWHNFHFTYEIHTQFTYQGGETFQFVGDDDLFVFIDKRLVIDLGGVHGAESAFVDLDTLGLTPGATYDFALFWAERHTVNSALTISTSIRLQENVIPEPLTAAGMMLAVGGLGAYVRRRR